MFAGYHYDLNLMARPPTKPLLVTCLWLTDGKGEREKLLLRRLRLVAFLETALRPEKRGQAGRVDVWRHARRFQAGWLQPSCPAPPSLLLLLAPRPRAPTQQAAWERLPRKQGCP